MKLKEIYKPIQFKGYSTYEEQKTDANGWIYPEMDLGLCDDYVSDPTLSPGTYIDGRYVGITPPWKNMYPTDASFNNPNGLSNPTSSNISTINPPQSAPNIGDDESNARSIGRLKIYSRFSEDYLQRAQASITSAIGNNETGCLLVRPNGTNLTQVYKKHNVAVSIFLYR